MAIKVMLELVSIGCLWYHWCHGNWCWWQLLVLRCWYHFLPGDAGANNIGLPYIYRSTPALVSSNETRPLFNTTGIFLLPVWWHSVLSLWLCGSWRYMWSQSLSADWSATSSPPASSICNVASPLLLLMVLAVPLLFAVTFTLFHWRLVALSFR